MRIMKLFIAGIVCLSCRILVPASFAGNEFVLVGGTRAVIEGKQLILIDKDSRRSVAPPENTTRGTDDTASSSRRKRS